MAYLLIGIAGASGALLRYIIGVVFFTDTIFPYATLLVNLTGSFLLTLLVTKLFHKFTLPANIENALATGFIGSFTTFSALSIETVTMFTNGDYFLAIIYILLSVFGGLFFSYLGCKKQQRVELT